MPFKNIAWIEDEMNRMKAFSPHLNKIGYNVIGYDVKNNPWKKIVKEIFNLDVSLIFLDFLLVMDGQKIEWPEIFQEIRKERPTIPIVGVSAQIAHNTNEIKETDLDLLIPKPFPAPQVNQDEFDLLEKNLNKLTEHDWYLSVIENKIKELEESDFSDLESILFETNKIVAKISLLIDDMKHKNDLQLVYKLAMYATKAFSSATSKISMSDPVRDNIAIYGSFWNLFTDHARMDCIRNGIEIADYTLKKRRRK
jgi:hypothetical protein